LRLAVYCGGLSGTGGVLRVAFGLCFLIALGVRLSAFPASKHEWDGHEAAYLDCLRGPCAPDAGFQTVAPLRFLARLVGEFAPSPYLLQGCALAFGLLAVGALMVWAKRQAGLSAAFAVGTLVCLWGEHAAWSTSFYQVIPPLALLWCAFWIWTYRSLFAVVVGGLFVALALACRLEWVVVALIAPLWVGEAARGYRWRTVWIVSMTVGVVAHPASAVGSDSVVGTALPIALDAFIAQFFWLEFGGVWFSTLLLSLSIWASWTIWSSHRRVVYATWLTVISLQLSGAVFVDWGYRHMLPAGTALASLLGLAIAQAVMKPGSAGVLARALFIIALLLIGLDCRNLSFRYYADADSMARLAPQSASKRLTDSAWAECRFLSEDPPVAGQSLPSHWTVAIDEGCWLWGEEFWHARWSSRALRSRGKRMHRLYNLSLLGVRTWPEDPGKPARWVYRVEGLR
jgi:hypothetical protein